MNDVYTERNHLVALLSTLYPSGRAKTAIEGWDEAWHGCVFIDFPWGQASWHYHESEAYLFEHLPPYTKPWDGHTTEQKYTAIRDALKNPEPLWRHPKIQSLIAQRARLSIQLSLVEQLLEDPYMNTTAIDMEYWDTVHDDLYYKLTEPREWQALTAEEVGELTVFDGLHHVEVPLLADFIRAIEAALKEKNSLGHVLVMGTGSLRLRAQED
jgi:hypothetical protein